jgi:hypothetical protein
VTSKKELKMSRISKLTLLILVCLSVSIFACSPKFHQTYLKNSQPDKPHEKVMLSPEIIEFLKQGDEYSRRLEMYWISDDNILVRSEIKGKYATYILIPNTKLFQKVDGATEEILVKKINERIDIVTSDTVGGGIFKAMMSIGGGERSTPYTGSISDNTNIVYINIKVHERTHQRGKGFLGQIAASSCAEAWLDGTIENKNTGKTMKIKWSYSCHMDTVEAVKRLFWDFRISPDGRYYLHRTSRYETKLYDNVNGKSDDLISFYDNIATTVSPSWGEIALLRNKGDDYWIEFYNLSL